MNVGHANPNTATLNDCDGLAMMQGRVPEARNQRGRCVLTIPERLTAMCRTVPGCLAWLDQLPYAVRELQGRWSLTIGPPWSGSEMSCAWVAPAVRADGTRVVLKLGMPHMEGAHELEGLRFWNGEPTVRLLEGDGTSSRLAANGGRRCTGDDVLLHCVDQREQWRRDVSRVTFRYPCHERPFQKAAPRSCEVLFDPAMLEW